MGFPVKHARNVFVIKSTIVITGNHDTYLPLGHDAIYKCLRYRHSDRFFFYILYHRHGSMPRHLPADIYRAGAITLCSSPTMEVYGSVDIKSGETMARAC